MCILDPPAVRWVGGWLNYAGIDVYHIKPALNQFVKMTEVEKVNTIYAEVEFIKYKIKTFTESHVYKE